MRHLMQKNKTNGGDETAAADQALFEAAEAGDVKGVENALAAGGNLNFTSGNFGDTPLTIASANGHVGVVSVLILAGVDVDQTDSSFGATALYWASQEGHVHVVTELIRAKADVNKGDVTKETPLIVASEDGHLSVVTVLIDAGADVNAKDTSGDTALHVSVVNLGREPLAITKKLVKEDAVVDVRSRDGSTPLMWAATFGNVEAARVLLNAGADPKLVDSLEHSALDQICNCLKSTGNVELLQCPPGGCDNKKTNKKMKKLLKNKS